MPAAAATTLVNWGTGNYSLVSMGDGHSGDGVIFATGNSNMVTRWAMATTPRTPRISATATIACRLAKASTTAINDQGLGTGSNNTLSVGNGNYDQVSIAIERPGGQRQPVAMRQWELRRPGDRRNAVSASPFRDRPTRPPSVFTNSGSGDGNVLQAGNGNADFLMGGAPLRHAVAGGGHTASPAPESVTRRSTAPPGRDNGATRLTGNGTVVPDAASTGQGHLCPQLRRRRSGAGYQRRSRRFADRQFRRFTRSARIGGLPAMAARAVAAAHGGCGG